LIKISACLGLNPILNRQRRWEPDRDIGFAVERTAVVRRPL